MEATSEIRSSVPNKLFLSGSDIQTPNGGDTPFTRPPTNGTSSTSVGTFAVKAGLAQMLKISNPILFLESRLIYTEVLLWM